MKHIDVISVGALVKIGSLDARFIGQVIQVRVRKQRLVSWLTGLLRTVESLPDDDSEFLITQGRGADCNAGLLFGPKLQTAMIQFPECSGVVFDEQHVSAESC
jgi:hypothetical protein